MTYLKCIAPILLWLTVLPTVTKTGGTLSHYSENPEERKKVTVARQNEGERKFAQNCSRCHNPPQSFSPHISGTIVLHMRVRASLSKQDEEDILRFLNP